MKIELSDVAEEVRQMGREDYLDGDSALVGRR